KLPQHPDYRDPLFKQDLSEVQRVLVGNFKKLEAWKPVIEREYEVYESAMKRRDAERQRLARERGESLRMPGDQSTSRSAPFETDAYDDGRRTLDAGDDSTLAVDLAHRELRRRDDSRRSTRQAGISPGTVASRRRGVVSVGSGSDRNVDSRKSDGYDDRDSGVREAGRYLQNDRRSSRGALIPARQSAPSHTFNYPSVPAKEDAIDWSMPSLQPATARSTYDGRAPVRPSKDAAYSTMPPLPPKPYSSTPRSATATPSPPPPAPHAPPSYTFKPSASTEAGDPLRTVMLPPDLRRHFLNLAHPNTARNLETCGILCGTLIANALFINHLILPAQTATSDTCDTTEAGDTALFDYCDAKDLLVCGWIHTHPSQSCFLSSRDLHTSSGYQIMLPEAIAIVCAPRHTPDWGIFRLTAPPGLQAVLGCHQSGLFHPHAETDLYTDALRPGHVVEGPGLRFEVVDLRDG
ncbi:hypothetical protein LTR53_015821, partial [Teratosphaeriaceae sp. CCFEE 6253]